MTSALATMRVDYDQVKIKDLDTSSNPLLNKRRKKAAAGAKSGSTVCQSQWDSVDGWLKSCLQLRIAAQPRVWRDDMCTTCFKESSSKIKGQHGTTAKSELDICQTCHVVTSHVSSVSSRSEPHCSLWAFSVLNYFYIFRSCLFSKSVWVQSWSVCSDHVLYIGMLGCLFEVSFVTMHSCANHTDWQTNRLWN